MKKRTLRLINYILIIIVLFGTMCLDKVQACTDSSLTDSIYQNNTCSYSLKQQDLYVYTGYSDNTNNNSDNALKAIEAGCQSGRVFATPITAIDDSQPCTIQMLGNSNSNISEAVTTRACVRYSARINALLMSASSDVIINNEHYLTYNRSMDNLFSIQTIVVNYIHNTDGEK